MKKIVYGFSGTAVLALALTGCGSQKEETAETKPIQTVHATLLTVTESDVQGNYMASGTVKALLNSTLSSKVMGRIETVKVREGDVVRKGQVLLTIDPRELQASVAIADANYGASVAGVSNAKTAVEMESKTSRARIAQAEAQVSIAQAALKVAEAKRDLAKAGPRPQEVAQSHIAVVQAQSNLKLAKLELDRVRKLVNDGALARREQDLAQNRYDLVKGQLDAALQGEKIALEGTRSQDLRAAEEGVAQARAALTQAKTGVLQAKASAMQVEVRQKEVLVAGAQVKQAVAAAQSARVGLAYTSIVAPFDGRVTARLVDPGVMANPGSPMMTVEGGEFRLEAAVPESVIGYLKLGNNIKVSVDSLGAGTIDAKVSEITPQGDTTSHSFTVKLSLLRSVGIKSGMFGRANIPTAFKKQIQIPSSATWVTSGLNYVFAVDSEGIARLRIVTLGDSNGDKVTVLSGLSKGDRIVVGNRESVTDGAKIEGN